MLKIVIVDDSKTFRDGTRFYLENILKHQVMAEYDNGMDYLRSSELENADVILMDIKMPKMNGIEAAKHSLSTYKKLKIIAVTDFQGKVYEDTLVKTGFKGLVNKKNIYQELQVAINEVIKGKKYFTK